MKSGTEGAICFAKESASVILRGFPEQIHGSLSHSKRFCQEEDGENYIMRTFMKYNKVMNYRTGQRIWGKA
jgi:hypothetical protein